MLETIKREIKLSAVNVNSSYPAWAAPTTKLAVIGAGAVGSTLAYAATVEGIAADIVLYDINKERVEAEALDIAQGIQFTPTKAVSGSDDIEICRNADVVVVTAGAAQKPGQTRLELAESTVNLMKNLVPSLLKVAPDAIYIMVTNPVDVVTYCSLKISGLGRSQMFGSGTVLDTSRLRLLVSQATGVAPQSIHAYIAGEHGDSEIPLWSSATIGNVPLTQWDKTVDGGHFDSELMDEIAHKVVRSAYTIIEGKGSTNYAIGLAVTSILRAIMRDQHRVQSISTLLEDWHGISDVCLAVPTVTSRTGAGKVLCPPLTLKERDGMTASAERLRQVARDLGF
ncbi:L-lactate dehydrogenase [Mobiluncus mulieris]|uniref:L-lactate dehydrogenase n=2 Tax=Mobiluncus mulieris TaxID=2052 RepID=E0QTK4_9ACTO|nr:L-lactate dehydrogenase [Mobiluncus mulieris]EEJ53317.1 L-lactate dehydrogenase [Mobiluncus mulieris ATCC 35243]EEZ91321.1 L-lactate dehydrogenase [Mobiluncus mulieris 28-1]EFM45048.1 L-lactate dehydrogenase [Mobiluncus mulieris ATCC 35239]EFN92373.1 L-lactate dehydrogenase [Mobiluncus mulieris FB024-16]MCU9968601.1 L-lactate dehydrogenase [Mobiluncus mulieris]